LDGSFKKKDVSYSRPTGRLDPNPAALAYASLELAALEYRARRGEIILLYEDETILWRFALPRAGWWQIQPGTEWELLRDGSPWRQLRGNTERAANHKGGH